MHFLIFHIQAWSKVMGKYQEGCCCLPNPHILCCVQDPTYPFTGLVFLSYVEFKRGSQLLNTRWRTCADHALNFLNGLLHISSFPSPDSKRVVRLCLSHMHFWHTLSLSLRPMSGRGLHTNNISQGFLLVWSGSPADSTASRSRGCSHPQEMSTMRYSQFHSYPPSRLYRNSMRMPPLTLKPKLRAMQHTHEPTYPRTQSSIV